MNLDCILPSEACTQCEAVQAFRALCVFFLLVLTVQLRRWGLTLKVLPVGEGSKRYGISWEERDQVPEREGKRAGGGGRRPELRA